MRDWKILDKNENAARRQLLLRALALILPLLFALIGTILLVWRFADINKQNNFALTTALSAYEYGIAGYFDDVANQGIALSEDLSEGLDIWLTFNGQNLETLTGNATAIADMERTLFPTLYRWLALTDCSGAYFLINTSASPETPNASRYRSGMYVKLANIHLQRSADAKLLLYRGFTKESGSYGLKIHNMWAPEFDADTFPDYDMLMEKANTNLNSCFIFTDNIGLPGTPERVMLLCVPIVGKDGEPYGICGFEVSGLYYKLRFMQSGASAHMIGLLTRREGDALNADSGFESSNMSGEFSELIGMLTSKVNDGLQIYTSEQGELIGKEEQIRLSPLERARTVAVVMSKAEYEAQRWKDVRGTLFIFLFLLFSAVLGGVLLGRMYMKPGAQSAGGEGGPAYTAAPWEGRPGAAETEKGMLAEKPMSYVKASVAYTRFRKNLDTLTVTEKVVFDCYTKNMTVSQIAEELSISINTVKFHNRNIYAKLAVSSRKELMVYVNMMEELLDDQGNSEKPVHPG